MSRRGKGSKALQLSTLRGCVTKLVTAVRVHEARAAMGRRVSAADNADAFAELNESLDVLDNQLQRVMTERRELVNALKEAIARFETEVDEWYTGMAPITEHLAEVNHLRAVASKYEVKS